MTIDRDYTLAHRLYKAIRTHVSLTFLSFVKFALWLKCLVQQKRYTDFIGNYFLLMYSPFRSFFVSRFLKAIFKEIFFFSTSCHAASLTFIVENLESLIRIQLCVQQRINTREKFLKINQIDCVHKDIKSKCFLFTDNFSNNKSISERQRIDKYYLPEYTCIHFEIWSPFESL